MEVGKEKGKGKEKEVRGNEWRGGRSSLYLRMYVENEKGYNLIEIET